MVPDVECDIREVARFYESKETGFGRRAAAELWRHLNELREIAGIHSSRFGFLRMVTPKPFQCLVFYIIESDVVKVYGVFDGRRDPEMMQNALSRRLFPLE